MSFESSKKCFDENIRLFADPQTEPEKFNLYSGLFNMADAFQQLEDEVRKLRRHIDELKR